MGNSDGIGLALTRRLVADGWNVTGVSRSASPVNEPAYAHHVTDVTSPEYIELLGRLADGGDFDLCAYFAGVGELVDPTDLASEVHVFDVNLMGMIRTVAAVVPGMVGRGRGHFIGVSSMADELLSAEAPSYHASKAGFSSYLGSLALTLKPTNVAVTNVRFGFVDTKMAKGDRKPLMMSVEQAVDNMEYCIARRPRVHVAPRAAVPLVKLRRLMMKLAG
ncbi:MAG: SDR family NAD(P)-dependent oxidoreductase [Candidatus Eisenbacteria bacterium]|nr:SDR family NAD(P)-dependent oxidoreductase [Candidatus Eisenbacteria bacterium]